MENQLRKVLFVTRAAYFQNGGVFASATLAYKATGDDKFFVKQSATLPKGFNVRKFDEIMIWFVRNWPESKPMNWELLVYAQMTGIIRERSEFGEAR